MGSLFGGELKLVLTHPKLSWGWVGLLELGKRKFHLTLAITLLTICSVVIITMENNRLKPKNIVRAQSRHANKKLGI